MVLKVIKMMTMVMVMVVVVVVVVVMMMMMMMIAVVVIVVVVIMMVVGVDIIGQLEHARDIMKIQLIHMSSLHFLIHLVLQIFHPIL